MTVDRPEDLAFGPHLRQPSLEGRDWAVTRPPVGYGNLATMTQLIRLRPPQVQDDAPAFGLDIPHVQAHQLGAPEAPGKAYQEQGPVPDILDALAHGIEYEEQVFLQQGLCLALGYAFQAPDPLEGGFDHLGARGVGQAPRLVRLGDRCQTAGERGRREAGSMSGEILQVQNNISNNFADIIDNSGLDFRIVMLARHGNVNPDESVCINAPLSGADCAAGIPAQPVNTATFFQYSVEIGSRDSLQLILSTYNQPDEFGLFPNGWSAVLRDDSVKIFVEITDDDETLSADDFETGLFALQPALFGDATNRNYIFHSIVGLLENNPATDPILPTDPIRNQLCTTVQGNGAVREGAIFQELSIRTEGLRFPICQLDSFDAVFQSIALGVVDGAVIDCSFPAPLPPVGQLLDLNGALIIYTPGDGSANQTFEQVVDAASCTAGAFFIENDIFNLCAETCSVVQADATAQLSVQAPCIIDIP